MDKKLKPRKIAILRALYLGDLLCVIPAVRAIKKSYPDSKIDLISLPWAKDFIKRFPKYFNDLIEFPGYPGLPEQKINKKKTIQFISFVQAKKYDLIFQMQGNGSIVNPLVNLFDARFSAGFYEKNQYCPNESTYIVYPIEKPEIYRHLTLIEALGLKTEGDYLEFPLTEKDYQEKDKLPELRNIKDYIIIHPGARDSNRRWKEESFAVLADTAFNLGYQVVLTGTIEEREITKKVSKAMHFPSIDLSGKTTLGVLGVLIKKAKLLIANDTGIAHLADAIRTPSFLIFLNSDISRWAPLDRKFHHTVIVQTKKIEEIKEELKEILENKKMTISTKEKNLNQNFQKMPFISL